MSCTYGQIFNYGGPSYDASLYRSLHYPHYKHPMKGFDGLGDSYDGSHRPPHIDWPVESYATQNARNNFPNRNLYRQGQ